MRGPHTGAGYVPGWRTRATRGMNNPPTGLEARPATPYLPGCVESVPVSNHISASGVPLCLFLKSC